MNIDIPNKKKLFGTVDPFSIIRVILFNIYKKYKRFYLFQGRFEVLKLEYFKHLCQTYIKSLLKHL